MRKALPDSFCVNYEQLFDLLVDAHNRAEEIRADWSVLSVVRELTDPVIEIQFAMLVARKRRAGYAYYRRSWVVVNGVRRCIMDNSFYWTRKLAEESECQRKAA